MREICIFIFTLLMSLNLYAADKVLFFENFERAKVSTTGIDGETMIGDILAKIYSNGGEAQWDVLLETQHPISGKKSVCFDIVNTGKQFFALQFRLNGLFSVKNGYKYRVSFKISSSVPNIVNLRCQVTAPNTSNMVNLIGNNEVQHHSSIFEMDKTAENTTVIFFAFGPPTVPGKIWIDDLKIEEIQR